MKNTAQVVDLHSKRPLAANDTRLNGNPEPEVTRQEFHAEPHPRRSKLVALLAWVTFHLLYWLRTPLGMILRPVVALSFLALPVMYFGLSPSETKTHMLFTLGGFSLVASIILWTYDDLLTRLSLRF